MRKTFRSSLAVALAAAVTVTSFGLTPAQAAPKQTPQATHQLSKSVTTDISARRRYRGNNNAAALAMFGLVAGGIAAMAANDRYNDGYYGGGPYYGGGYGYRGGGWHGRGGYHVPRGGFVGGHGGGHHWHR